MNFDDGYEQRGFLQKYGFALGVGAVGVVIAGLVAGQMMSKGGKPPPRRLQEVVMIRPLPPLPPPPKPPEPPKEMMEKMLDQTPVDPSEDKPDEHPAEAPSRPM